MKMRLVVTGGTGHIGQHLVRELVEQGHEIVVFDIRPDAEAIKDIAERVEIVPGDVLELTKLLNVIEKHKATHIVHLAALLTPEAQKNPLEAVKLNCVGTTNVLEAARIMNVKRVVWASSIMVCGPASSYRKKTVNEDTPTKPSTVYGACKALNEFMGQHYYSAYELDNVGLRFTQIFGPGKIKGHVFARELFEKPAVGDPVRVPFGDEKINWLYFKDAVNAIVKALCAKELKHHIFNIGGEDHTVREVASFVKNLIPQAVIEVEPGASGYISPSPFDITRAREELNWEPSYITEQGIKDYVDILRARAGLQTI